MNPWAMRVPSFVSPMACCRVALTRAPTVLLRHFSRTPLVRQRVMLVRILDAIDRCGPQKPIWR
jgi:hypothetical protein